MSTRCAAAEKELSAAQETIQQLHSRLANKSEEPRFSQNQLDCATEKLSGFACCVTSLQTKLDELNRHVFYLSEKLPLLLPMPPHIIFGARAWRQYLGYVVDEPPLPSDIVSFLSRSCGVPEWDNRPMGEVCLIVLLPHIVDGIPYSLSLLEQLTGQPKVGAPVGFKVDERSKWLGAGDIELYNQGPSQAFWLVIFKHILPKSRNKEYSEQVLMVRAYGQSMGLMCEVPMLLDLATCLVTHSYQCNEWLYEGSQSTPWELNKPRGLFGAHETYSRCANKLSSSKDVSPKIGSFSASQLCIERAKLNETSQNLGVGLGVRIL